MQSLKEKLHSAKGSSLLIVMVYFLLCLFVGGVVLTAATANGGRLAAMKADHQANYAQRGHGGAGRAEGQNDQPGD